MMSLASTWTRARPFMPPISGVFGLVFQSLAVTPVLIIQDFGIVAIGVAFFIIREPVK